MRAYLRHEDWDAVLAGAGPEDLVSASEIVVCGPQAEERMRELRARGIEAERLSWEVGGQIRDFHWHDYRWAHELPKTPVEKYVSCGIDGLRGCVSWRENELIVVAGPYASGKSLFAQLLVQDFVNESGSPVSLTCWEDQVDEVRDGLVKYRDSTKVAAVDRGGFLEKFRMTLVSDSTSREISRHFERIEYEAKRFKIKFFVLDPWNEFDHLKHKQQSDADYVIAVLTKAAMLCNSLMIKILITTHVAAEFISQDGDFKPFKIANAFGTSQFGNKSHRAFCVARTTKWSDMSHMIVCQDKVKLEDKIAISEGKVIPVKQRMGRRDTLVFEYSPDVNAIHHCGDYSKEAKEKWR